MKKIVFTMGLIVFVLSAFSQSTSDSWLDSNFHSISTVAENSDYSDLQFLKEELRNKNIVAIGEQTHKDGTTFKARSRLIQFLIKEMEFEAIIFESGIYDVRYGWKSFKSSGYIMNFSNSIMEEWRTNTTNKELFLFLKKWSLSGNTLEMGGFDCKFTSRYRKKYTDELDANLILIKPEIQNNPDYIEYRNILEEFGNATFVKAAFPNLSKKETRQFIKGSELVRNTLKSVNHHFLQTVISMDDGILLYSSTSIFKLIFRKSALMELNNGRDILMAEALNHLLENDYKNKKVILFGATYHFIRNNQKLTTIKKNGIHKRLSIPESIIMGDLLSKKYKKDIYTIGFTAYSGYFGRIYKEGKSGKEITPAEDGSLEKKLHDSNLENGLLILSNKHKKPDWWHNGISIRLFSYESSVTSKDWSDVLDAVFYVQEMEPLYDY